MEKFMGIMKAIFTGYFTGLVISIPLGPAGIESVKRTISKGYREGFTVSLGALLADIVYLFLINCGLSNLLSKNKSTEALFWIFSGLILTLIGCLQLKSNDKSNNSFIEFLFNSKLKSLPLLVGFFITFFNPMTPTLWLTLSGTVIRAWYYVGEVFYYTFLFSILIGMITWFAALNYFALKGFNILTPNASKKTSYLLKMSILVIGLIFIVFGFYKLIF